MRIQNMLFIAFKVEKTSEFRGVFNTLSNIYNGPSNKNTRQLLAVDYFQKKVPSWSPRKGPKYASEIPFTKKN